MHKILLLIFCCLFLGLQESFGQESNAIRLSTGGKVTNTIIYGNAKLKPVSAGVQVRYSASDSLLEGENLGNLPPLVKSPFDTVSRNHGHHYNDYHIYGQSPVYNSGTLDGLTAEDTLDLDFTSRVACDKVDIGVFEHPVIPTDIILEPEADTVCEGTSFELQTDAVGENVSYQWQKNGENIVGQTSKTLIIDDSKSDDAGEYRVIALGTCCNDTSVAVTVVVDERPEVVAMNDTIILSGADVLLRVISSVGDVKWLAEDYVTPVDDLLISNITNSTTYIAVATNGVCVEEVQDPVQINVDGMPCTIGVGRGDTMICFGDSYQLLPDLASTGATVDQWLVAGTDITYEAGEVIWPEEDLRLVARGYTVGAFSDERTVCYSDTLTVSVRKLELDAMVDADDEHVCREEMITLKSVPEVNVEWYDGEGVSQGTGNREIMPHQDPTNLYYAELSDGVCSTRDTVYIYVYAPTSEAPIAKDTIICIGDSVKLLATNIDADEVTWYRLSDGERLGQSPVVSPAVTEQYRASVSDDYCEGMIFVDITVEVEALPPFIAMDDATECKYGDNPALVNLLSAPIASWWTTMDGTRLSSTTQRLTESQSFVAVYNYGSCQVHDTVKIGVIDCGDEFQWYLASGTDCEDNKGWAEVNISGGAAPFTFLWSNGDTAQRIFDLDPGMYSVTVTDFLGNIYTDETTIAKVDSLKVTLGISDAKNEACSNGSVTVEVTGGVPKLNGSYTYAWSDGRIDDNELGSKYTRTDMNSGDYVLQVEDSRGCVVKSDVSMPCAFMPVLPSLYISPNGDGKNDWLQIENIGLYLHNTVVIVNTYGAEIIRLKNYDNDKVKWDGRNSRNQIVPDGVYYYIIEVEDMKPMAGWVLMKVSKSE
ncbi:MAG: gliding motility-associated C-terminal domain-containing protein [Bacteroidales bacterium]|jgi:gliding motility-associated-like protein|nr:gliding motility-associated C-terminal domain-containing protein [Bacteroidales bacterium]